MIGNVMDEQFFDAQDIFRGRGVEILIDTPGDFLKIAETLTRIGIPSFKTKTLYQCCHILHKRGRYRILHFKELFELDGKESTFSQEDKDRRDQIVIMLDKWGILKTSGDLCAVNLSRFKILSYKEKHEWELRAKYTIGPKKNTLYNH